MVALASPHFQIRPTVPTLSCKHLAEDDYGGLEGGKQGVGG